MKCGYCDRELNGDQKKFCSRSCAARVNNRNVRRHGKQPKDCGICGKKLRKSKRRACSHKCHDELLYRDYVAGWLAGHLPGGNGYNVSSYVRRWLVQKFGERCSICGWAEINPTTGRVPVQTEHKDGDPYNHRPDNLCLICPNHHSLTATYGGLNKGHGRKERHKRA